MFPITAGHRRIVKKRLFQLRLVLARVFGQYTADELVAALRRLGLAEGDSVFLHSSFRPVSGFQGSPGAVIDAVRQVIGPSGNLMMVSMPYRGATAAYLKDTPVFDVQKDVSRMGLITEVFRRRRDVVRSLSPTHPVLASGPDARWAVAGHELAAYPCGPGTPFEKALILKTKAVFFDVPFRSLTFFHFLEHRTQDRLPVPLYDKHPIEARVRDACGIIISVPVYTFSTEARQYREADTLEKELTRRGWLRRTRIGNTTLLLAELPRIVECVELMASEGRLLYSASSPVGHGKGH